MTFFFDNTFPKKLVDILKILGVDATHLQEHFSANTPDVDWLPEIGRRGWTVVTGDRGISRRPAERRALEEANVIAVFMEKGFTGRPIFDQVAHVIKNWPTIESRVAKVKPGTALEVGVNGKVQLL